MVRVLSFNIEYGAQGYPLDKALAVIRESRADVVAVAEAKTEAGADSSAKLAEALGWNHVFIKANESAVISRWPLRLEDAAAGAVEVGRGARTGTPSFFLISAHLTDFPYQPFQAHGIPYCYGRCQRTVTSPAGIARAAAQARGEAAERLAETARRLSRRSPVIIAGDFNEPSHLDWTERAAAAGLCPAKVLFPTSRRLYKAGLVDAFRAVHPDEVKTPGTTWPEGDPGYEHRADRIDFVYVSGFRVLSCDVVHTPSDHSAVLAVLEEALNARRGGHDAPLRAALSAALAFAAILLLVIIVIVNCVLRLRRSRRGEESSAPRVLGPSSSKQHLRTPGLKEWHPGAPALRR
jgi:endonuclease/exonuclease/phosphatase family metal-dependent hydrolase